MTTYSMTDDPADYANAPDLDALRERMQDAGDRLLEAIEGEGE